MDINSIGVQFLDSSHIPLSSSAMPLAPGLKQAGEGSFESLLKRTQNALKGNGQASPAADKAHAPGASKKSDIDKTSKLYELCQDLETFLIKNLIKSMRSTVQKTKLIDTGFAGEMYEDMLYDEYAKDFSKNADFGFAEMAYRELSSRK